MFNEIEKVSYTFIYLKNIR